ncbi:hypothetical protein ABL78_8376 [Leptomonas seymouri]|uniref:Uncharacterized protein n=1 Tax=Leptomonas seymouri TaxID=5684 RepID=A0A0N1I0P3_LEPSE|nr:hypothetical protein ABL78_8376 [Leptomonas seymouri]|eukprot:KPI82614.1 hypothetical protein ABL78_8376 [Leptomonas seymouri]
MEILYLAATPFNSCLSQIYVGLLMNIEDMWMGGRIRAKRARLREVCPFHRATYVEEAGQRFLDAYMKNNIGWHGLLLHRLSSFNQHYLHYYYQHEYAVAQRIRREGLAAQEAAVRAAVQWMAANVPNTTLGYGRYTVLDWAHSPLTPRSQISPGDNVHVYEVAYLPFTFDALDRGYESIIAA